MRPDLVGKEYILYRVSMATLSSFVNVITQTEHFVSRKTLFWNEASLCFMRGTEVYMMMFVMSSESFHKRLTLYDQYGSLINIWG